jgi:ribosomal protein L12E/L44/L45/RPP1/RPP2
MSNEAQRFYRTVSNKELDEIIRNMAQRAAMARTYEAAEAAYGLLKAARAIKAEREE